MPAHPVVLIRSLSVCWRRNGMVDRNWIGWWTAVTKPVLVKLNPVAESSTLLACVSISSVACLLEHSCRDKITPPLGVDECAKALRLFGHRPGPAGPPPPRPSAISRPNPSKPVPVNGPDMIVVQEKGEERKSGRCKVFLRIDGATGPMGSAVEYNRALDKVTFLLDRCKGGAGSVTFDVAPKSKPQPGSVYLRVN